MPGPGGHRGPGGHGGPGGGFGGRPGGMGGGHPGRTGGMGHRPPPPPPHGGGWSGRRPYGRGCCGCFLPIICIALIAVVGIAMLLF